MCEYFVNIYLSVVASAKKTVKGSRFLSIFIVDLSFLLMHRKNLIKNKMYDIIQID